MSSVEQKFRALLVGVEFDALARMVRDLNDPRGQAFLLLLSSRKPLSRKLLLATLKLTPSTLDRALRWLRSRRLADKIQGRTEVYWFPLLS